MKKACSIVVLVSVVLMLAAVSMVFAQNAALQKPAKITLTFNAIDIYKPGGLNLASNEQYAEYLLTYPMPPMPGPTFRCLRADVSSYSGVKMGGEFLTKGSCDQNGGYYPDLDNTYSNKLEEFMKKRREAQWPLRAGFRVNQSTAHDAFTLCKKEWQKRISTPLSAYVGYPINTAFQGTIDIKYCYLNMQPTISPSGAQTWSSDCAKDNIRMLHTVNVPLEVTCNPQPINAAHALTAYGYSCPQNSLVVKGTTRNSTDRMTPIPQPIPDKICVPLADLRMVFSQTCPAGYVFEGTNLNARQNTGQQPQACVWAPQSSQGVMTQAQYAQQKLAHPGKVAQVTTQYQYTCRQNYVIQDTTAQSMTYPGAKPGLACDPKPGMSPEKADIWLEWRHSCKPGMIIHGSQNQNEVIEILPRAQQVQNKYCLLSYEGMQACPFIFTQESPEGEWLAQGTILTHHKGKGQERTQVVGLSAFSGSILIREIDPETSYIDSLSVVLYYADGSKEVLLPDKDELKAADGHYLVTDQGDDLVVGFEKPSRPVFVRAEAIANGYYEPY